MSFEGWQFERLSALFLRHEPSLRRVRSHPLPGRSLDHRRAHGRTPGIRLDPHSDSMATTKFTSLDCLPYMSCVHYRDLELIRAFSTCAREGKVLNLSAKRGSRYFHVSTSWRACDFCNFSFCFSISSSATF